VEGRSACFRKHLRANFESLDAACVHGETSRPHAPNAGPSALPYNRPGTDCQTGLALRLTGKGAKIIDSGGGKLSSRAEVSSVRAASDNNRRIEANASITFQHRKAV